MAGFGCSVSGRALNTLFEGLRVQDLAFSRQLAIHCVAVVSSTGYLGECRKCRYSVQVPVQHVPS